MAPGRTNGAAKPGAPMEMGSTTAETFPVRIDGEVMEAYNVTNRRAPSSVFADLDDARIEWENARVEEDEAQISSDALLLDAVRQLLDGVDKSEDDGTWLATPDFNAKVRRAREALARFDRIPHFKPNAPAWTHYVNRCVIALIPGLTYEQADGLDAGVKLDFLIRSGRFSPPSLNTEAGDDDDPPVAAPASTGEKPEPDSLASTT